MADPAINRMSSTQEACGLPAEQRMGRYSLTMAWWGICSAMFYLVVAAALAMGYGTLNALIGLVLSVVSYGLINAVITRHAIACGLSVAEFSQVLFGRSGAALATLIFSATAIYYGVFEGSVMAVALQHYAPAFNLHAAFLLVVAYSVLLIFGNAMRWLDKLNGVLLPFYLIGLAALVFMAINTYGYSSAWLELAPEGG
ncbi:TPA: allantoin permease, partial [Klebsiella pneumoniae]